MSKKSAPRSVQGSAYVVFSKNSMLYINILCALLLISRTQIWSYFVTEIQLESIDYLHCVSK